MREWSRSHPPWHFLHCHWFSHPVFLSSLSSSGHRICQRICHSRYMGNIDISNVEDAVVGGSVVIQVADDRTLKQKLIESDLKVKKAANETEEEEEKYKHWLNVVEDEYVQIEKEFNRISSIGRTERASASRCCIFNVPKALLELKEKRAAYIPQIVSLGPFHFLEAHLDPMEDIKSEVVRSVQLRLKLQGKCFKAKVVGEIKRSEQMNRNEKSIRDYYDKKIPVSTEVLAWMMARDASFILQFLTQRLFPGQIGEYFMREIESLSLVDTLKDIVKLENQIPLFILRIILQIDTGMEEAVTDKQSAASEAKVYRDEDPLKNIVNEICSKLSPISIEEFNLEEERHILECLRSYVVGHVHEKEAINDQGKLNYFDAFLYHAFQWFLWIIYIILYPCIWKRNNDDWTILQPAVELHKAGVKFKPFKSGIQGIRFDHRLSTLYLPEIKVDIHTETIMRNMMAFELCSSSCIDKAVIRYAHLMDQLINTEKDVTILSKSGIICNKLENDSKVADFWNSLTDSTSVPNYEPIDNATNKLKIYYRRRRSTLIILWNEFLEDRCSKPWHVFAFVASIVILIVTVSTAYLRFFRQK